MKIIKEKDYQEIKRKMNKQDDYFTSEEYTNLLKDYLGTNRNWKRNMFSIVNTLYRAVKANRITWEQAEKQIDNLGGATNGK